ncbi:MULTISPECIES: hypothetical protein [unclassified Streptomyces]|uniref:hypothetical protein n=1 Tax=unclassified Streptomyces TaxID=2593676 RepID=UPI003805946D
MNDIVVTANGGHFLLSLHCGPRIFSFAATKVFPSLPELLLCLQDISEGRDSAACRWRAEPGGVFLDFTNFDSHLTLAVHEMSDAPEGHPAWSPVRGHPLVVTHATTATFLSSMCTQLRSLHSAESRQPRRHYPAEAQNRLTEPIDLSVIKRIEDTLP